jgi:hypothetical protein
MVMVDGGSGGAKRERRNAMRVFLLGVIIGGLTVWLCRQELQNRVARSTGEARARAVGALEVVESASDRLLSGAADPLRRGERALDQSRESIGRKLRAWQERIRPHERAAAEALP